MTNIPIDQALAAARAEDAAMAAKEASDVAHAKWTKARIDLALAMEIAVMRGVIDVLDRNLNGLHRPVDGALPARDVLSRLLRACHEKLRTMAPNEPNEENDL